MITNYLSLNIDNIERWEFSETEEILKLPCPLTIFKKVKEKGDTYNKNYGKEITFNDGKSRQYLYNKLFVFPNKEDIFFGVSDGRDFKSGYYPPSVFFYNHKKNYIEQESPSGIPSSVCIGNYP